MCNNVLLNLLLAISTHIKYDRNWLASFADLEHYARDSFFVILCTCEPRGREGVGGLGAGPHPSLDNHKAEGFLWNSGMDPWKTTNLPSHHLNAHAFRWALFTG